MIIAWHWNCNPFRVRHSTSSFRKCVFGRNDAMRHDTEHKLPSAFAQATTCTTAFLTNILARTSFSVRRLRLAGRRDQAFCHCSRRHIIVLMSMPVVKLEPASSYAGPWDSLDGCISGSGGQNFVPRHWLFGFFLRCFEHQHLTTPRRVLQTQIPEGELTEANKKDSKDARARHTDQRKRKPKLILELKHRLLTLRRISVLCEPTYLTSKERLSRKLWTENTCMTRVVAHFGELSRARLNIVHATWSNLLTQLSRQGEGHTCNIVSVSTLISWSLYSTPHEIIYCYHTTWNALFHSPHRSVWNCVSQLAYDQFINWYLFSVIPSKLLYYRIY